MLNMNKPANNLANKIYKLLNCMIRHQLLITKYTSFFTSLLAEL